MNVADHVLRDTRAVLDIVFTAGDADGDAVVATVRNAAGVTVSTGAATPEPEPGRYSYALAPQPEVASLTVTWSGTWGGVAQSLDTWVEIIGAYLFTVAELRAAPYGLTDTARYPDAMIRETRAGIAQFFERVCGQSFVPKYAREQHVGQDGRSLWLRKRPLIRVLASNVSGVALSGSQLAGLEARGPRQLWRADAVWASDGSGTRNVLVEYEYGLERPVWDIHRAALRLAYDVLVPHDFSDRTVSWTNELGTFRNAVAGREYPTGVPEVDAALVRNTVRTLVGIA